MPDEIHSSSWTGPPDPPPPEWERRLLFHGMPTFAQISAAQDAARQKLARLPAEQRAGVRRSARLAGLLLISPLFLLGARLFAGAVISGAFAVDHSGWLNLWAIVVVGFALFELRRSWDSANDGLVILALCATVVVSVLYGYAAVTSREGAIPAPPERTFEIVQHRRQLPDYLLHQRADGTTVEGEQLRGPMPYGMTCAEVQRFDGAYAFAWVKVLDRSPPPAHEVLWPIRREDCFSNKPLATLHG